MNIKILYISPENTVGVLSLWKKAHEERGNYCRYITLYPSKLGYEDDIVLNLPFVSSSDRYIYIRNLLQKVFYKRNPEHEKIEQYPIWSPVNYLEKLWFQIRDFIWSFFLKKIVSQYKLDDFDIYHFEWGLDIFRDCRFSINLAKKGKSIVCHYHGPDLRIRGVIPPLDKVSKLNLTNEVDLLTKHKNISYIYLPYDTKQYQVKKKLNKSIRIFHCTMNRYYKGSDIIINVCKELEQEHDIEFILMEREPHNTVMEEKYNCDINIDQISNTGGWGYGMNSIESLSMGICTATNMNSHMKKFMPNHPFYEIDESNLYGQLEYLILNPKLIMEYGKKGKKWVDENHNYLNVTGTLYEYYLQSGIIAR